MICERDKKGLITVPGALKLLEGGSERPVADLDADRPDSETDAEGELASLSLDGSSWGMMTPSSNNTGERYEFLSNRLENLDIISLTSGDSVITPSMDSSAFVSEPLHPNQCHICKKLFKKKKFMEQHLVSPAHMSVLPNQCPICKKIFRKQAHLKDHLASPAHNQGTYHVSEPLYQNQCRICKKIFKKRPHLEQHLASPVHAPKIYHCKLSFLGLEPQVPIKKFKSLSGLVAHIETGACRGGNSTFDIAASMLGTLAAELRFPSMVGITKRLGGKFGELA
ncbi:hypothetical protein Dda_6922 [Drechslerella dactyloides]|uniref:C2H2-type domain-containing protein n=1 Tax=Drechslerella dactyloides TaxID=74499 RepID=A0AAD6NH06_DREDA|nr:hypothetical protein Dda_6922 [Drechslerella dactyloides]